jgi:ATP-dependent helicase/nuclease subunit B
MSKIEPSVFSIAPGSGFLHVLAREILNGFPLAKSKERPPLSQWIILLPTRRAARELTNILAEIAGSKGSLLPRIKPIGDLDEDQLVGDDEQGDLPQAISRTGELFTLLALLDTWAKDNPQIVLAQEIHGSHVQSLGLATSLLKLLTQIETEENDFSKLGEAFDADLSEHRNVILSLIGLLKVEFPKKLAAYNLMSPTERRNRLIRLEAKRISDGAVKGPIIAAGSTGTIPATRALLKAISQHSQGAVILPGLDRDIDEETWNEITPEHPQHSLKTLTFELGILPKDVKPLGIGFEKRNWLASEIMRPANTAEQWHKILKDRKSDMAVALQNLHLLEAPDRHSEARSIALIFRHALETPHQKAALITPDRDLAKRVKAELTRWNIVIDDSAGEPLVQFGLASLVARLLDCVTVDFTPASLLNLLTHQDCSLGMERELFLKRLRQLEVAVLRGYGNATGLEALNLCFEKALMAKNKRQRSHTLVAALQEDDWQGLQNFVLLICSTLKPLSQSRAAALNAHLDIINTCITALAPIADQTLPENIAFTAIIAGLKSESIRHPICSFAAASVLVLHFLRNEPHRETKGSHPRLAIYGVLEARLIPADVVILGGLNEGKWPAQPDPGPWLNRPLRTIFGMQQPEREIGVSAHDFTQGFGHAQVYLTWSKRIAGSPQIPSRWILRLQTVMLASGMNPEIAQDQKWIALAKALDEPNEVVPFSKPMPTPPVDARPTSFSVSAIEQLIRDPYAIYASKVLRLQPLPPLAQAADAPLRGTLFHEAINNWNLRQPQTLADDSLDILIDEGRKAFAPLMADTEVASFWWPRFLRMANWLVEQEAEFRQDLTSVHAEIDGRLEFEVEGVSHSLTARADRIDILENGEARIIDYKTGQPPTAPQAISGMKPQLPLEAAILALQGFTKLAGIKTSALIYLHISGAADEGKSSSITLKNELSLTELGLSHLAELKVLLQDYRNAMQAYFPRANMFKEDDKSDYDHLSRFAEWILAGDS